MPIVFVHGVNNRAGDEYRDNEIGRNSFISEIVGPALGLSPESLRISSPYWGGNGAKFRWNMAVLPDASESIEKFGAEGDAEAFGRTVELLTEAGVKGSVVQNARTDFAGTVDLLFGSALAAVGSEENGRELAQAYRIARKYAEKNPTPEWLNEVTDDNFADVLNQRAKAPGEESMGAGGILDQLKEGLSRIVSAIPSVGSSVAVGLARKKLNATVTKFAGDAFVYLARRGAAEAPGKIVEIVLSELHAASAAKTDGDDKLIVIAHSFGGEIVYDILTKFDPGLSIDVLITVGSQVGLFEEMKLYLASDDMYPDDAGHAKVPMPSNLKRWLNVFDPNDVLSFLAEPIFAGVQDFKYDTGFSTLQAHGGYFLRPSFYSRLAARLSA